MKARFENLTDMKVKSEKGFMLIELIMTILILAILSAVVSLSLTGLATTRLDQAVNKVVGDLRYAQQLAISTQIRHGMTIDPSALQYTIHRDGAPDTAVQNVINLGTTFVVNFTSYQQGQLAGVVFTSATPFCGGANSVIEFNSLGAPTTTAGAVLACTSSLTLSYAGNNRTITIQQNTGSLTY